MDYPTNRQQAQKAVKGKRWWCFGCDRYLVGKWGKCPVCGWKEYPKKVRG